MKCIYTPETDASEKCSRCYAPLCNSCFTYAELNDGLCQVCRKEFQNYKIIRYVRTISCATGVIWLVLALFIIPGESLWNKLSYGLLGIVGAMFINFIVIFILSRMLLSGFSPQQKVIVGLYRYAVSGYKNYFDQAVKQMEKIDDFGGLKDALFDQIVSVLILQPFNLPEDWIEYLSEKFHFTEEELLENIVKYGTDVFYENIFNNYNYQAIEPLLEILKRTNNTKEINNLMDQILKDLQGVDINAVNKPVATMIPGVQTPPQREDPKIVKQRALLTELKIIETELEEFLVGTKRKKDFDKIKAIIDNFELPAVPKNTFDAVRMLTAQQQQQPSKQSEVSASQQQQQKQLQQQIPPQSYAPGLIAPPKIEIEEGKNKVQTKVCAECGIDFPKEQMRQYIYENVSVRVCNECEKKLEKDGHRKPKKLQDL